MVLGEALFVSICAESYPDMCSFWVQLESFRVSSIDLHARGAHNWRNENFSFPSLLPIFKTVPHGRIAATTN